MTIQYREALGGETRNVDDNLRQVEAKVCSYGVGPDTYNTTWQRGWATEGFEKHGLPVICWSHDSRDVIGSATGYRDEEDGLYLTMQFADPDAVPSAKRAYSLLKDGHVRGWSFGFSDGKMEPDSQHKGAMKFRSGRMFEASPVVRASIPLTRTVSVRSADGEVREADDDTALAAALHSALVSNLATGSRAMTIQVANDGSVSATHGTSDDDGPDDPDDGSDTSEVNEIVANADDCSDKAEALVDRNDSSALPLWVQQALQHFLAAGLYIDQAMDELGIPDADSDARGDEDFDTRADDEVTPEPVEPDDELRSAQTELDELLARY